MATKQFLRTRKNGARTPMDTSDMTLTEALRRLGFIHAPRAGPAHRGRRVLDQSGTVIWEGTAGECWKKLRAEGLIL